MNREGCRTRLLESLSLSKSVQTQVARLLFSESKLMLPLHVTMMMITITMPTARAEESDGLILSLSPSVSVEIFNNIFTFAQQEVQTLQTAYYPTEQTEHVTIAWNDCAI